MTPSSRRIAHPQLHDPACRVKVARRGSQLATVALIDIEPGAVVLLVDGDVVAAPSRYSVQVDVDRHVDVGHCPDADGSSGRFVWRFLNHSCDPNSVLHGRLLVARRAIAAGAEVTFDYDANEWEMAEPFVCGCGSARCRGLIRGFRHLTAAQQSALLAMASPHIARLALQVD